MHISHACIHTYVHTYIHAYIQKKVAQRVIEAEEQRALAGQLGAAAQAVYDEDLPVRQVIAPRLQQLPAQHRLQIRPRAVCEAHLVQEAVDDSLRV